MNEMLTAENVVGFLCVSWGSRRSTPIHLHQHIVFAFVLGLAAKTVWQGSLGLGMYKQEEKRFRTRAENRCASSPKQLLFLPVDPGGRKYSTLLCRWPPHNAGREQWSLSPVVSVWIVSGSDDIIDLCPQED